MFDYEGNPVAVAWIWSFLSVSKLNQRGMQSLTMFHLDLGFFQSMIQEIPKRSSYLVLLIANSNAIFFKERKYISLSDSNYFLASFTVNIYDHHTLYVDLNGNAFRRVVIEL